MAMAAAPSFIPEAFPAVTVPSFLKTGFNLESVSKFIPSLGCSSLLKSISDFVDLIFKFTISSLNLFSFCAVSALFCDFKANLSC